MTPQIDWSLYLLIDTGALGGRDPLAVARAALDGGASVLQLRAKGWSARRQLELALALLPLARARGVPLLINDQLDIALAAGADGVHLGVDDLPVEHARALMPAGLLGYSPEGLDDAWRAQAAGASYLGVGPFAGTSTKPDAGAPIGPEGLRRIAAAVGIPVVAVGGITPANAGAALAAGAAGVAVASAVVAAPDPALAARALRAALPPHGTAHESARRTSL